MHVCGEGSGQLEAFTPNGTRKDVWGASEASEISVQPVLLNKQVLPWSCPCCMVINFTDAAQQLDTQSRHQQSGCSAQ